MVDTADRVPFFARLGRWVFPRRLLVPLPVVALGVLLIHPRPMFGRYQAAAEIVSALIVLIGVGLRFWGGGSAGNHTRTDTIEAPQLITGGPFAYVRNPIYLGSALLGLGMVGLLGDPWMLALHLPAFTMLYAMIVPAEEAFLRKQFGAANERYRECVPRMIPRLTPWRGRTERPFDWSVWRGEAWIWFYLVTIYAALRIALYMRA